MTKDLKTLSDESLEQAIRNAQAELERRRNIIPEMDLSDYLTNIKQSNELYGAKVKVKGVVADVHYGHGGIFEWFTTFFTSLVSLGTIIPYISTLDITLANDDSRQTFRKYDIVIFPWQAKKLKDREKKYTSLVNRGDSIEAVVCSDYIRNGIHRGYAFWIHQIKKDGKIHIL